jgi:hypothetical protein
MEQVTEPAGTMEQVTEPAGTMEQVTEPVMEQVTEPAMALEMEPETELVTGLEVMAHQFEDQPEIYPLIGKSDGLTLWQ